MLVFVFVLSDLGRTRRLRGQQCQLISVYSSEPNSVKPLTPQLEVVQTDGFTVKEKATLHEMPENSGSPQHGQLTNDDFRKLLLAQQWRRLQPLPQVRLPGRKAQTTLTTNDIVISKLTQILSYLRQGTRHKKIKKKDKGKLDDKRAPEADLSIFDDIGETTYRPRPPAEKPTRRRAPGDGGGRRSWI
ncbi:protein Red, partial [Lates japonicus]